MAPRHSRKRVLRVTPRVAQRVKELGRSQRFKLNDFDETVQRPAAQAYVNAHFAFWNQTNTEEFILARLRADISFSTDTGTATTTYKVQGPVKLFIVKCRTGESGNIDTPADRKGTITEHAQILIPNGSPNKDAKSMAKILSSKEVWPTYAHKKYNDERPDGVVWTTLRPSKPVKLMPGDIVYIGYGMPPRIDTDGSNVEYNMTLLVRCESTSNDLSNNQAPSYANRIAGAIGTSVTNQGAWDPTWRELS